MSIQLLIGAANSDFSSWTDSPPDHPGWWALLANLPAPATAVTATTTDLTPTAAAVAVTGTAPTLISDSVLSPAAAAITVTGSAPTLDVIVTPPGGSLTGALITVTGTAPTLTMSLVTTGATITITGGTPSTAGEAILTPAASTITVTGTAPTLLVSMVPGSGTLPVTGGTPTLISATVLSPAGATITIVGSAPSITLPVTLNPASASITITGSSPVVTSAGLLVLLSPPAALITATGLAPTVTNLGRPRLPAKPGRKFRPIVGADGVPDPRKSPISAYRYLDAKRDLIDIESRERPLIRLWDNQHKYVGTLASEQSLNAEELLHDTGQCDIVVRADDWLIDFMRRDVRKDEDLHITIDPYPHRRNWRWRYGAKVTNVRVKRAEDGLRTVTLECSHNREHWKHLLFGATPFCDPAVQPLRAWLLPGNTRTVIATTAFINLARNFWPILALPTQALNPGAWTGQASRLANLNPLNWPVQIQFVNPIFDQSRFSVIMSRWSDAHSVTEGMLRDAGCHVRAYVWLPEDEDSPHPELAALVGQAKARPTRACVVLAVEDASGVSGPTGTAIDGAINFIASTADNLVTENLIPVDADGDGVVDPLIRRLVGVAPKLPAIAFRDTERSSIVSSEHSMFRSKAQKVFTGGKSPGWVNQLQTFAIKYALSQISYAIQTLAGPELTAAETPGSPGLEEIYQGQFDNMLLAYISITDPVRSSRSGPYGYLEHFEQGSGSAYTVSSSLTLREGHYKTRAYQGFKVAIRNGGQHTLYYDIDLGTRCHFEIDGIFHTDQVTAIKLHYDLTTAKTFDLAIGDDRESENPMASATRAIANIWNAVGMLFGSGDLF